MVDLIKRIYSKWLYRFCKVEFSAYTTLQVQNAWIQESKCLDFFFFLHILKKMNIKGKCISVRSSSHVLNSPKCFQTSETFFKDNFKKKCMSFYI